MAAGKRLPKVAVALVVLGALGFLFMRSVRHSRTEAYTVAPETVARPWSLAIEPGGRRNDPIVTLRPPAGLFAGLSGQLFKRTMEALGAPTVTGMPLVLQGELASVPPGQPPVAPAVFVAAAHEAGLDVTPPRPVCLAHRRSSGSGGRRDEQLYFVIYEVPGFQAFRQRVGSLLNGGAAEPAPGFTADLISPALMLALIESTTEPWLPLHADPRTDCVAPIAIAGAAAQN